jgi:Sulfatase
VPGVTGEVIAGHGAQAMPASFVTTQSRRAAAASRRVSVRRDAWRVALIGALHVAALGILVWSEYALEQRAVFLATWGLLNCFWIALVRRPAVAAALSLALVTILVTLSYFKFKVIWTTANFVDLMVIDTDTINYLFTVVPGLSRTIALAAAAAILVLTLIWRFDSFRLPRLPAVAGFGLCLLALTTLERAVPLEPYHSFYGANFVSTFARSGVDAIEEYLRHGYLESEPVTNDRLGPVADTTCQTAQKPPHIILVHDESSFDIRKAPGIKVPPGYGSHFKSFDGRQRNFIVEGAGGPSWFTEYNVLSGLSARSFGRFAYFVSHIAAGRVERGLPRALHRCGYQTFTAFPALQAFMAAKSYQATAGIEHFYDSVALGTETIEADSFYYNSAIKMIEKNRANGPVFVYVYLAANHFPWDYRWRPDLAPQWQDLGNPLGVDEYLRRQSMSFGYFAEFLDKLKHDMPGESFLIVRYGDHQPDFASLILEPGLDDSALAKRLMDYDPRYFTTYYAINTVNYRPVNPTSALDTIEGPYLPLVILESAGLPLDPSFAEQKRIFERCAGLFYACAGGKETRRFNRLLIDAGLIKNL